MQNQPDYPQGISLTEAMRLASTPQGQAIIQQLQQEHSREFESAMAQAQAGNYAAVKQTLSNFLNSPDGQALMQQLRGQNNG